eukprot:scaffold5891_cov121-Isochrysis_galbana.AAC.16
MAHACSNGPGGARWGARWAGGVLHVGLEVRQEHGPQQRVLGCLRVSLRIDSRPLHGGAAADVRAIVDVEATGRVALDLGPVGELERLPVLNPQLAPRLGLEGRQPARLLEDDVHVHGAEELAAPVGAPVVGTDGHSARLLLGEHLEDAADALRAPVDLTPPRADLVGRPHPGGGGAL